MNAVNTEQALQALQEFGAKDLEHLNGDLATHLKGTYELLGAWGSLSDLCLAGLYHAVYGTDGFSTPFVPLNQRSAVVAFIGPVAEEMVYLCCAVDRLDSYPRMIAEDQPCLCDRFTGHMTQPHPNALGSYCELTLANELEIELRSGHHFARFGHVFGELFGSARFQSRLSNCARQAYAQATRQMHAVIFDIDGTLLKSNDIDGSLYLAAVRSVLGGVRIRESWGLYRNVTDRGLLEEILRDNSLPVTPGTLKAVRDVFVDSVDRHVQTVGPFTEIPGARRFVTGLLASSRHRVAYATGGWSASAATKLSSAGFPTGDVPLASSDDHSDRQSIMRHALTQLGTAFESVTYYGDQTWDETATRMLGWTFVPVGKTLGGLRSFEAVGVPSVHQVTR